MDTNLHMDWLKKSMSPVFFETGTEYGYTTQLAFDAGFRTIITVELDPVLYRKAVEKFIDIHTIWVFNGSSHIVMATLLPKINVPITFWLDAHVQSGVGPTPLLEELNVIAKHCRFTPTIFIDDVRMMESRYWSEITPAKVEDKLRVICKHYKIEYLDNRNGKGDVLCAKI